jgi:hypothetical protein
MNPITPVPVPRPFYQCQLELRKSLLRRVKERDGKPGVVALRTRLQDVTHLIRQIEMLERPNA